MDGKDGLCRELVTFMTGIVILYNVEPYSSIFNIHLTFPNGEELDPSALVHRPRGDRDL